MGYRNLTCHHFGGARLSLFLSQSIHNLEGNVQVLTQGEVEAKASTPLEVPASDQTFLVQDNLERNV